MDLPDDVVLVSPERFADMLGVGRATLFEMIADGRVPKPTVDFSRSSTGRRLPRWRLADVRALIKDRSTNDQ